MAWCQPRSLPCRATRRFRRAITTLGLREKDHPQLLCSEGAAGVGRGDRRPQLRRTRRDVRRTPASMGCLWLLGCVVGSAIGPPHVSLSRPRSRSVRRTRRYVCASAATPFTLSCEPIKPLLAGHQDFPHEPWRLPTLERTRERRHGASDGRKDVGLEVAALIDRRCAAIEEPRRRCDRTTRQQVSAGVTNRAPEWSVRVFSDRSELGAIASNLF
jgi:hypothetical protein